MPLIAQSEFETPKWLIGGHLQTILPALFRKVPSAGYKRERIATPDDDFLDLDMLLADSNTRLLVLCHGLEGDSHTTYIMAVASYFHKRGWDVLAMNYRGCSGEMNRQLRFYHSGATGDVDTALKYMLEKKSYSQAALAGYSLGGNIVLKYLGEMGEMLDSRIKAAAVFSVPCDLEASALYMARWQNKLYMNRFLYSLKQKIRTKHKMMPDKLSLKGLDSCKNFHDFDGRYTAPIHGFRSAEDYYAINSSKGFIKGISIPTLIVNAKNDPFLTGECYPVKQCMDSKNVWLEMPETGGHVAFPVGDSSGDYWPERRAYGFISQYIS